MDKNGLKMPWLVFFRVVNLPTVPGDVMVGAAACVAAGAAVPSLALIATAAASSCCIYMFGLADNDIVGAATDSNRPIPSGSITLGAAKRARFLCLAAGVAFIAAIGAVPVAGGGAARSAISALAVFFALAAAIVAYNRTKSPLLMGLCRGLNVLMGAATLVPFVYLPRIASCAGPRTCAAVAAAVAVWTLYISAVTKYSEGEEADAAKRRRVGALVGGIVYLQLAALIASSLANPENNPLLVAGAILLVALRLVKVMLPRVGAS